MISPLSRSIALASLFISPSRTSLAFTSTSSSQCVHARSVHRSKTVLLASAADDNSQQQQPRPSLSASSSHEQQFSDIDLPHDASTTASSIIDIHHSSNDISPPSSSSLDTANTKNSDSEQESRSSEFHNLEPLIPSPIRRSRLEVEQRAKTTYIPSGSDPYWQLQDEIQQLEKDLQSAMNVGVSDSAIHAIKSMLRRAQSKDPEHVYKITSGAAKSADMLGRQEASLKYREESSRARKMLPQFNLEGLWVGKYGSHGFEMINVTYSGDRLIAYKVTGDKNIPRGEITFTADLSPFSDELPGQSKLDPILLSESSAKKWGTTRLPRFRGQGHAAEPGFVNHQFMEGQLVVIGGGDYFSFAWVPLEHQIFFGRPSPELTLKMLREGGGTSLTAGVGLVMPDLNSGVKEQREYVSRCLEVTCDALWEESTEGKVDPMSCIWHGDDDEYCYFE